MSRENIIKDKIILIVKNAIADYADIDVETDTVTTDSNGVDHLAEQVAEEVYKMFEPVSIDEQGALGPSGKVTTSKFVIDMPLAYKEGYSKGVTDGIELNKTLHNEKCAEFNKLCYDYAKIQDENKSLRNKLAEYKKPVDEFIKGRETKAVREFAKRLKDLLYTVYGDYGAPLGDITAEDIACDIDELLKEYE